MPGFGQLPTPREYKGDTCSGTQSSRRIDPRTIEIVYKCPDSWTRFIRRLSAQPNDLAIDIAEKRSDDRRVERCLILEKQPDKP